MDEQKISVEFIYSPSINFAMQQNHVPVVRKLFIKNISGAEIPDITVEIKTDLDFATIWTRQTGTLIQEESLNWTDIDIKMNAAFLAGMTEKLNSSLLVTVFSNTNILYQSKYTIDILAYDQWSGAGIIPEMIAAFITPNHDRIPQIIKRASTILEKWTGDPSFNEYQSNNPDRVKKQIGALYEAIAEFKVVYCIAPASFEEEGQRVRLCDTLLSQKLGNCLDMSLLLSACLEAVGLRPIIIIIKSHAFIGIWLIKESFADSVNYDASLITKRIAEGITEIVLVECTAMNAGVSVSFDEAVRLANHKISVEEDFLLFVDVKRARYGGIRPLPLRIITPEGWQIVDDSVTIDNISGIPETILPGIKLRNVDYLEVTKQRLWERKLLDLSLRNSLLNIRVTKNTVQLIAVNLAELEDALSNGAEFQILPKPNDWDNPLRSIGIYKAIHSSDPIIDLVKQELVQKKVRSYLSEAELGESMTNLSRLSRLAMDENGANTLYFTLGLLKWYETPASERPRYAPLLLIPVEIIRKSAQKGYIIRSREEETTINITLLEMLRQDFGISIGGLEELPKDESGVDVKTIFGIIRQAILPKSRWEVEEQSFLGTFSFSKFIMWNDIHNNSEQLKHNKIVASLVSGKLEWDTSKNFKEKNIDLDRTFHPSDVILPISADSSQLEAIIAAIEGETFVLHGPPGTGKSQTITNIIANALYKGKRVLFVAEKMAALSVVQKRLSDIGLADFCLELHSNKAKKSLVLEQLKRTTEVVKTVSAGYFQAEAERIHKLRNELNEYVETLHKTYHFGFSLYEAFSEYARLTKYPDKIRFDKEVITTLSNDQVIRWFDIMEELQAAGKLCGHLEQHPLKSIQLQLYNQDIKNEAKDVLAILPGLLEVCKNNGTEVVSILQLKTPLVQKAQLDTLHIICKLLLSLHDAPVNLFAVDNPELQLNRIVTLSENGKKRDSTRAKLLESFTKDILVQEAEQIIVKWKNASSMWLLPKWLKQRNIIKQLNKYSIIGNINKVEIVHILESITDYQKEQTILDNNAAFLIHTLENSWKEGECDWELIIFLCHTIISINQQIKTLTDDVEETRNWRIKFSQIISGGFASFLLQNSKTLENYLTSYDLFFCKEKYVYNSLVVTNELNNIDEIITLFQRWYTNIDQLRDWCSWLQVRTKAWNVGLNQVIAVYENGELQNVDLVNGFKKSLYKSCANYIISREPNLSSFNGRLFEEKIRKFRELSEYFEKLTKDELFVILASKIPFFAQEASQSSEIGILQKAIRNGGRGLSIRKLFDLIPNVLPRMSPCMLMSPISVAQYLDISHPPFDLIIFDEASQMPTCEAIGAMARGTNVIVVGDPKQMPPTSFFAINNFDEENQDEDLDSILDDCLGLSVPSRYLSWHYRSRHESLIAFSNAQYYDNALLTFPSPDDLSSKVKLVPVIGSYDRGKTKQNIAEAREIVSEIIYRLNDPVLSIKSIGVVTFSSVQQKLVQDLLDEALKDLPNLELKAFSSEEPIFIKNLENVQGDERDVILFSVGYGPDNNGKVYLNFGPLNREGGWRRLNVAVSRARYEMKVFSTLGADQIDISKTSAEGVAGLKAFLEYAGKGKSALPYRAKIRNVINSPLEESVSNKIKERGYNVHMNVGCSGFKIDIAIINPEQPKEYLLAVLCDGYNYRSAKTVRDREIIQMDTLKKLGWNIHRIWSADWWENGDKVTEEIVAALELAKIRVPEVIETHSSPVLGKANHLPDPTVLHNSITDGKEPIGGDNQTGWKKSAELTGNDSGLNESDFLKRDHLDKSLLNSIDSFSVNSLYNNNVKSGTLSQVYINNNLFEHPYKMCLLESVTISSSEEFLLPCNNEKILNQIHQVLAIESPISRNLLCRRVITSWGISKIGTRIKAHFDDLFGRINIIQTGNGPNPFFWSESQTPGTYAVYRVAKDQSKRDADDLPDEEIAVAARQVLINQISLSTNDLIKETSKLFGYAYMGNNVLKAMQRGIKKTVDNGHAKEENGRIVLK